MKNALMVACCIAGCIAGSGYAGSEEMAEEVVKKHSLASVNVRASGTGWSDIDGSGGEARFSSVGFSADLLFFNIGYSQAYFEWQHVDQLPFGDGEHDPWKSMHDMNFGVSYGGSISEVWSWFGNIGVQSAYEQDVDGAFGYYALAAGTYRLSDSLNIIVGAGGAGYRKVHSKWSLFPMVGLGWNETVDEGISVIIGYPDSVVTYQINRGLSLSVFYGNDGNVYRLDDDSTVVPEGYMETDFSKVGMAIDYAVTEAVALNLGVSYLVDGTLTTFASDGDKLERYDVGSALRMTASASYAF